LGNGLARKLLQIKLTADLNKDICLNGKHIIIKASKVLNAAKVKI
jgi:hypothetical protein